MISNTDTSRTSFVLSFLLTVASCSLEPDRFPGQRPAEAPGGRALHRGDDRPHQPGVHPDPGGADGAGGTAEEEDSAGEGGRGGFT